MSHPIDPSIRDGSDGEPTLPTAGPRGPTVPDPTPVRNDDSHPTFTTEARELLREVGLAHRTPTERIGASDFLAPPPGVGPEIPGFDLLDELGRGGMGVVYKARDLALSRLVALKMVQAARAAPDDLVRFEAESVAVAAVRHANVVQVFGCGRLGDDPYFVMEFLPGGTLAQALKVGGRMPPREAAALIGQLAAGAHAIHAAGFVHRDIKPGNVLFDGHGVPKLTDFGLAKRGNSTLTRTEAVLGTPAYMAPEQAGGRAKFVGPQADVYALGVLLYECLAGERPFAEPDTWSLIKQVLASPPPPLAREGLAVPRDLELICLKCLEKEPHDRYPTAEALADDLARFARGAAVSVRPTPVRVKAARLARRYPLAFVLALVTAAVAVGVPALVVRHEAKVDAERALTAEVLGREEVERRGRAAAEGLAAADRKLAEEADLRRADSERARVAAVKLADFQKLIAIIDRVRRRATGRPAGWTWQIREDMAAAVPLAALNEVAATNLRSAAAEAALAADMREIGPAAVGLAPGDLAVCPVGDLVAVGERKPAHFLAPCRIRLLSAADGAGRDLSFSPALVSQPEGTALDGVRVLAFTRDGRRLFAGTRGGWIHRFDLSDPAGRPDRCWPANGRCVSEIAVSPDDRTLYVRIGEGRLFAALDAETGAELGRHEPALPTAGLVVHPISGAVWAAESSGLVPLEPVELGPRDAPSTRFRDAIGHVRASADGRYFYVAQGETVAALDADTLRPYGDFLDPGLRRGSHEGKVERIAVCPSGEYLATAAGGDDRTVKLWRTGVGRLVGTADVPGSARILLAWSRDGRTLFAAGANETYRFEVKRPSAEAVVGLQHEPIDRAAFAPDGAAFAALGEPGAYDSRSERALSLVRFDPAGPVERVRFPSWGTWPSGLSFRPDGGRIALCARQTGIRFWDPPADAVVARTAEFFRLATYDPAGRSVWSIGDGPSVRAWDAADPSFRPLGAWRPGPAERGADPASLDALAVGRTRAVAGGSDGRVHVFRTDRVHWLATLDGPGEAVGSAAVGPDGALAAVGTQRGTVRFLYLDEICEGPSVLAHAGAVTAVAFSRNGRYLASGSKDRSVKLWKRRENGAYAPTFTVGDLPAAVRDLRFAPNDDRLMVLLAREQALRIWDLTRLKGLLAEARFGW